MGTCLQNPFTKHGTGQYARTRAPASTHVPNTRRSRYFMTKGSRIPASSLKELIKSAMLIINARERNSNCIFMKVALIIGLKACGQHWRFLPKRAKVVLTKFK